MYGYIYLTTNKINNKIYIGQKHSDKFLFEKYLGSGKLLTDAVKKYGKENFSVIQLDEADTPEELDNKEIYWIAKYNSTNHDIGYNICEGGAVNRTMVGENNPFYGKVHSPETKETIGKKTINWYDSEINKKKHSQNTKQGMSDWWQNLSIEEQKLFINKKCNQNSGKNNPMYGKNQSDSTKEKISIKHTEYLKSRPSDWADPAQTPEAKEKRKQSLMGHSVSKETRQKLSEINKLYCWVHNDCEKIHILKSDLDSYLIKGYSPGRGGKTVNA